MPVIRSPELPPAQLARLIRTELKELAADLAQTGETESVHGARRRLKRLRSLLRLLRTGLGESAYQAAATRLKVAADALAGRRRAEALVTLAGKLGSADLAEMVKRHHKSEEGSPDLDHLRNALQSVTEASKAALTWKVPRRDDGSIEAAFLKTYRKARKKLAAALKSEIPAELHEARKQTIHHIHHLATIAAAQKLTVESQMTKLEALRETLGDLNDLDELKQIASAGGQELSGDTRKLLRKRHKHLLAQARNCCASVFRFKAKAYARRIGVMQQNRQSRIAERPLST